MREPKDYFAVFRCCTTIPETGDEVWREEFHLLKATCLEEALEQADQRAAAQACEYLNEGGQTVRQHPATVTDVQEFLFPASEEAVYQRPLPRGRPTTCYDLDVFDHYIAIVLDEARNERTGATLYSEEVYLVYGQTKEEARRKADELASYTYGNEVDGDQVRYLRRLVEFAPMESAPKDANVHSRYFRDRAAYDAFLKSVEAEYAERKVP